MSEEKIRSLSAWVAKNPGLADVPSIIVNGVPLSPREALNMIVNGIQVEETIAALTKFGIDPTEAEMWILAEAYLKKQIAAPGPKVKVVIFQQGQQFQYSLERMLEEVKNKTDLGYKFLQIYGSLLAQMQK